MYKKAKYIFEIIKLALENKKFHLYSALKDEVALNKGVSLLTILLPLRNDISPMYHCKIVMPYLI